MTAFTGFSSAALDFYDDLEVDNSRSFWAEHKAIYQEAVRAPMEALLAELTEFGPAKIFRPYRDVRFARDKTPYKTHQGAFVAVAPATGWYVQLGAPGVRVAAGFYHADPERLARYRRAVDDDLHGPELEKLVAKLRRGGWDIGGDRLKTSPRGYAVDHPRIELLRHRSLNVTKDYGFEPVIESPELVTRIRKDWKKAAPLVHWVRANATFE